MAHGFGFGLAAHQASALELGDISVQSALGQPLRASIAYALAPNESIQNHCIFLRPGSPVSGLPAINDATATLVSGVIRLTGTRVIREPLLDLQLTVNCPGTANLSRQYSVFIDPPSALPVAAERPAAAVERPAPTAVTPVTTRSTRRTAAAPKASAAPIRNQNQYQVQPGDTLSGIASRITDRDITIWQAVDRIFAANPEAFIGNDLNRLRAGSVLVLPDLGSVADANVARAERSSTTVASPPAPASRAAVINDASAPVAPASTGRTSESTTVAPASTTAPSATATARPADATATENPFVEPLETSDDQAGSAAAFGPSRDLIPDTEVDTASVRRSTVPEKVAVEPQSDGVNSLAWLGGAGIAIILGLLLFGRRFRDRFGSSGDTLPAGVERDQRYDDAPPAQGADPTPGVPNLSAGRSADIRPALLDADLGTGSGFEDDGEIDVAQDFGFSTSRDLYGELDIELSGESTGAFEQPTTDIRPPARFDEAVIVEEIPASEPTGDYDMSMIVDATRQPIADSEDTTKDLKAIQVDTAGNDTNDTDSYTLSREIDYKILEQDYEDELTATQALSSNIMEEAEAEALHESVSADHDADAETVQYAFVGDELTSQLPDAEDFDPTEEMPLNQELGAEPPAPVEESGVHAELTTELPAADNDAELGLEIESATIDTKKLRAS